MLLCIRRGCRSQDLPKAKVFFVVARAFGFATLAARGHFNVHWSSCQLYCPAAHAEISARRRTCFRWPVSRVLMLQDHSHQYVVKKLLTKLLCGNPKRFLPTDVESSRTIRHDLELAARYFQGSMLHAICLRVAHLCALLLQLAHSPSFQSLILWSDSYDCKRLGS